MTTQSDLKQLDRKVALLRIVSGAAITFFAVWGSFVAVPTIASLVPTASATSTETMTIP